MHSILSYEDRPGWGGGLCDVVVGDVAGDDTGRGKLSTSGCSCCCFVILQAN